MTAFTLRTGLGSYVKALFLILCLLATGTTAKAYDDDVKYPFGKLNMDPTPVTFNVGGIYYRIPANYMLDVRQSSDENLTIASMTAVFPGMRPFSESTKACYQAPPAQRGPDCQIMQIFILYPGEVATSDPVVFERNKSLFYSQMPTIGPYGFEQYQSGGGASFTNHFRKKLRPDLTVFIHCSGYTPNTHVGICDSSIRNKENGVIMLRFDSDQLGEAEDAILTLRTFINDHTLGAKP